MDWRIFAAYLPHICHIFAAYLPSWIAVWICAFGVKLIALEIHNQLTAEPITLIIVANDSVLILSSGVYCVPHTGVPFVFALRPNTDVNVSYVLFV